MKSFTITIPLSLLLLSISLKELSANKLTCESMMFGIPVGDDTCEGEAVVCGTAIETDTNEAKFKGCREKFNVESLCGMATRYLKGNSKYTCPYCTEDLCNNQE